MKALIVGAGISGISTAISLSRRGIDVEIVEISPHLRVLGSGISLIAPAVRALDRLGVLDECLEDGWGVDQFRVCDVDGNEVVTFPLPPADGSIGPGLLGLMRPRLHQVLLDHANALGADVRAGVGPVAFDQSSGDQVVVEFTDGTTGRYDLVVGADGLRSTVRSLAISAQQPVFRDQGCFRAILPRDPELQMEHDFAGVPDAHPGLVVLGPDTMYLYCNVPAADASRFAADELPARLRAALAPFSGMVGRARELITDPALVNYAPFETILVTEPWNNGRIVILGDAAHSTTPHLASGGAMCLEDAVALGEELAAEPDVPAALAAFVARRFPRCSYVVRTSVQLSAWQLAPDTPGATPSETLQEAFALLAEEF